MRCGCDSAHARKPRQHDAGELARQRFAQQVAFAILGKCSRLVEREITRHGDLFGIDPRLPTKRERITDDVREFVLARHVACRDGGDPLEQLVTLDAQHRRFARRCRRAALHGVHPTALHDAHPGALQRALESLREIGLRIGGLHPQRGEHGR